MGDGSQISTSVTIISSLLGYQAISLTAIGTASAPTVAAGSKLEVASSFFTFSTECTPNGTSWTAITTATSCYIAATPAGSAGNQTLSLSYIAGPPVWVDSKCAFYASAASNTRVIAHVYKTSATAYDRKAVLLPITGVQCASAGAVTFGGGVAYADGAKGLKTRVYELGEWDMSTTSAAIVTLTGSVSSYFRAATAWIRHDDDAAPGVSWKYQIEAGGYCYVNGPNQLVILRTTGGLFDSTDFDATAGSMANRGWAVVTYEVP